MMPLIDDDGTDGSSVVWTIENFSYCLRKPGDGFDSPSFILGTDKRDRWRLTVWPRGKHAADFSDSKIIIAFGLKLEMNSTSPRVVGCTPSIRNTRGSFKKKGDFPKVTFSRDTHATFVELLKREELRGKGDDTYLDNDTLTLRCRIWKVDDKLLPPGQCYVKTIVNVERNTNIWPLEKFRQSMSSDEISEKQPISFEMSSLVALKFILYRGESFSGDRIKLEIQQIDKNQACFLTCDLSLLEAGGKVVHSIRDEHRFDASEVLQVWPFPYIPLSKILGCEKPYLRCELAVSSGSQWSWVERVENGQVEVHSANLKQEHDFSDSWRDDLQRFYSDAMFTDLTIRTSSKDFSVHKAMLCARSSVFHAMFEQDMKENRSGVVDIEDIDADTVHKMLLFAYSDIVEDLNCDVASKLYFAADKYRITALRRCSDFLKENLSVSNVCEVCVLANLHQDEDLKSFVQDFILEHAAEVMRSVEWERFMQDQLPLASKMMHMLFLRNLSI